MKPGGPAWDITLSVLRGIMFERGQYSHKSVNIRKITPPETDMLFPGLQAAGVAIPGPFQTPGRGPCFPLVSLPTPALW